MKSFVPLCALLAFCVSALETTLSTIKGKTLREVYGDAEEAEAMWPYHRRPSTRTRHATRFTAEYYAHRTAEICDFPIELVIVQDTTDSFDDDIANMKATQLQLLIDALSTTHPGSAIAAITFKDKPLWPLGGADDYCLKMGAPLSTDPTVIKAAYENISVYGGGDPPESQFHALVAAAQSDTPGWGTVPTAARLIVVVTDAAPHFEGDGFNTFGLPVFSGTFDEANADSQCVSQYYPTPTTVKEAVVAREAYFAALVYDGSSDHALPIESWKWFNGYLNQTDGFVHDIENDSSNFWVRLSEVITLLEDVECGDATTVAPPDETVTPVGTVEVTPAPTLLPSEECPPCPTPCPPTGCDPCCREGVLIKLEYRPKRLHLEVEN